MTLKVAVVMGSGSDFETMRPAFSTLREFGVRFEARVISGSPHAGARRPLCKRGKRRAVSAL